MYFLQLGWPSNSVKALRAQGGSKMK